MIRDYVTLALNSLRKRRLRSWLTMIGIFIGIAALVSLIGLGEGLRYAISSQFGALGADMITIQASGVQYGPPGSGAVTPLTKDYATKIDKLPGVKYAISRMIVTSKIEFNNRMSIGYLGSMPDGAYRKEVETIAGFKAIEGRLLKDGDKDSVVVGNNYIKTDIFGKAAKVGDRIIINGKQFNIIGILKKTGSFTSDIVILMNEDVLRQLFDKPEETSLIAVKVENTADINQVKQDIEKLMRKERNVKEGEEDFIVELAVNTIKTLDSTLFAVQLFVYIIAGISIVVGGIGIMNTMFTAVIERTKEIGIMKSIGAKNSDIFWLFFIESGLLGMVGGIVGIIIGIGLANGMAFAGATQLGSDLIKAHISAGLIVGALVFSFVIGCAAGTTPAVRASKLHPVDALRYGK
jgi:putative ABC transport system permease protein